MMDTRALPSVRRLIPDSSRTHVLGTFRPLKKRGLEVESASAFLGLLVAVAAKTPEGATTLCVRVNLLGS